ncbi:beta carbonic anhydrase 5, chloroplastic-like isoform X2 [Olea europaea var. sylvestris]|uniref:Carbonic anhydrase n=1 Tax=Olea europaea subsp. europaea TaxID=158383 RepID=A0A8S0Q9M5_OLEEU|nr:beta carbonic anhydrase 5, chloroplastic-like isoform X2 [Olea europaea var. sylvestris]CAA2965136.1 beta carbonic anhydrase 5, chloroplastic isoform X1 [Olea europaea subsp. europaea]
MSQAVFQFSSTSVSMDIIKTPAKYVTIFGSQLKSWEIEQTHMRFLDSFKRTPTLRLKALRESPGLTQEIIDNPQKSIGPIEKGFDAFEEMRHRFLSFKKDKYLENLEHYQTLARGQAPKFMVIACADSRVCPSSILGFQPGEAFVVRNVANLVPPHENGPTETNAALEFAVNSLEVENILVVGHSCCGGIHALMSMQDEMSSSSSFIKSWVVVGKAARLRTIAAVSDLNLDQQCRHCEKESINRSLLNLLTYPWIEDRVEKGMLSLHGGYYDFADCTFEKWTLDCKGCRPKVAGEYSIKNREFWS